MSLEESFPTVRKLKPALLAVTSELHGGETEFDKEPIKHLNISLNIEHFQNCFLTSLEVNRAIFGSKSYQK